MAGLGHQKIPKRPKTLALVRVGNRVALAHDLLQQRALGPVPQRDTLAHPAVQSAKVLLHLPKISEQLTRQASELLEPLFHGRVVQQADVTALHAHNFCVNLVAALAQLGQTGIHIGLAAHAHLLEQLKQGQQARLGADKRTLTQTQQPRQGALGSRRQIKMRFVRARRVVLAQPTFVIGGPVIEVLVRGLGVGAVAQAFTQAKQGVLQCLHQVGLRHDAYVGRDEHPVQKARHQRRMLRCQQAPGRVLRAQCGEGAVV